MSHGHSGSRRPRSPSPDFRYRRDRSPPRRPPPFRRRHDEFPYRIPSSAPSLRIPSDLPVDVTAFLDLVAFFVVQGGPTAEEEITKREENNPSFAFLYAPWRDPMQLYYRWRIYSLLQGDTLLKWRVEPYQIERGPDAYVWIPPPAIASGAECLLGAFSIPPRAAPTSAAWLSRMSVSEGAFFVTLEREAVVEWQDMLRMEHVLEEALGSLPAGSADGQRRVELSIEERLVTVTKILLDGERIAQRMMFAVEHQNAALHMLSLVLDEAVRVAYDAAGATRTNPLNRNAESHTNNNSTTTTTTTTATDAAFNAASRCVMCLSILFTLNDIGRNAMYAPVTEEDLTLMHSMGDEGGSAGRAPQTNTMSSPLPNSTTTGTATTTTTTTSTTTATTTTTAGTTTAQSDVGAPGLLGIAAPAVIPANGRLLSRALEKIMPTLVEATLLVALCTIQQYGSLVVDRSSTKPPGSEETEGILPLDIDQAAYVNVHAKMATGTTPLTVSLRKEDRDAVCMIAMLLISWLKQLCASWAEGDVIGNRCWGTLLTRYACLFSQTIETT